MRLRHSRGSDAVRHLGAKPKDARNIIETCAALASDALRLPAHRVEIAVGASRARPTAKGRYLAGTVTLFPAAFADPLTLAWTVFHEFAHAAGLDEPGADAFAARFLTGDAA